MNSAAAPGIDAGQRRRQLPAEVSAFVGRSGRARRAGRPAARGRHVTVTGPGGVGKTRLALRAAADAAPLRRRHLPGRALRPGRRGAAARHRRPVPRVQRARSPPARAAVLDHLRGRRLLLIFDTCEHLTAAFARFASQLLRETSGITILATSRQPLHLAGEQVLRLGPLPVPRPTARPAPGGRGRAVRDPRRRRGRRVHGLRGGAARRDQDLPAARRHAARRSSSPPSGCGRCRWPSWPARLTPRSRCWPARGAARSPRQQTLRAAIDWSYGLCTEAERAVWERLSVFAGSFDLAAARDVAACRAGCRRAGRRRARRAG